MSPFSPGYQDNVVHAAHPQGCTTTAVIHQIDNGCLRGAPGGPQRSPQWDYRNLVEEIQTSYGLSSEHMAAMAVEWRQCVFKLRLFVFSEIIYVANCQWPAATVPRLSNFTNAVGV